MFSVRASYRSLYPGCVTLQGNSAVFIAEIQTGLTQLLEMKNGSQ